MLKLNVLYNAVYLSRSIRPYKYPKTEFEMESKVRHSLLYIPLPFERQIQTSSRTWLCALFLLRREVFIGAHLAHKRFFGGVAGFARLLSSRVVWCVVYAKVPWLLLHAKYRTCKAKQAAAPFFSRSQHTHNTRREKPVTEGSSSQVLFSFFTCKKLLMVLSLFEHVNIFAPFLLFVIGE